MKMEDDFEVIIHEWKSTIDNKTRKTIHLSKTIQNYFIKKGANIQLDKTIQGEFLPSIAFIYRKKGRSFSSSKEFDIDAETEFSEFYIIYLEENNKCSARVKIFSIQELSKIVFNWIEKGIDINKLKKEYPEIEIFKPIMGLDDVKSQKWNEIKNHLFTSSSFFTESNLKWNNNFDLLLEKLSKRKDIDELSPILSHLSLILKHEGRHKLNYAIAPSRNEGYHIFEKIGIMGGIPTIDKKVRSLNEAIEFYVELLHTKTKETK